MVVCLEPVLTLLGLLSLCLTKAHCEAWAAANGTEAEKFESQCNSCVDNLAKSAVTDLQGLPIGDRAAVLHAGRRSSQVASIFSLP